MDTTKDPARGSLGQWAHVCEGGKRRLNGRDLNQLCIATRESQTKGWIGMGIDAAAASVCLSSLLIKGVQNEGCTLAMLCCWD